MAAGDPDLTFSGDGHVSITFASSAFEARAVALRGDGKTIVAGSKGGRLAVVRLNVDGSIDSTFAAAGCSSPRWRFAPPTSRCRPTTRSS